MDGKRRRNDSRKRVQEGRLIYKAAGKEIATECRGLREQRLQRGLEALGSLLSLREDLAQSLHAAAVVDGVGLEAIALLVEIVLIAGGACGRVRVSPSDVRDTREKGTRTDRRGWSDTAGSSGAIHRARTRRSCCAAAAGPGNGPGASPGAAVRCSWAGPGAPAPSARNETTRMSGERGGEGGGLPGNRSPRRVA